MTTTVNAKLDFTATADMASAKGLGTAVVHQVVEFSKNLAAGTGADQVNACVSKTYTITASGTQSIDFGSIADDLGTTLVFTAVKAIIVKPSTAAGVQFEQAAAAGFFDWAKATGDGVKIPAGGLLVLAAPEGAGWATAADADDGLLLTNLSGAVSAVVQVMILGVATQS